MSRYCVGCGMQLFRGSTYGESSIYQSRPRHILCESCFEVEEALIDNEGTNNLPDVLKFYEKTLDRCHAKQRWVLS